jgi:hypothetical protein
MSEDEKRREIFMRMFPDMAPVNEQNNEEESSDSISEGDNIESNNDGSSPELEEKEIPQNDAIFMGLTAATGF